MKKQNLSELIFFWVMFGVAGMLTYLVMSAYLMPIFLAGICAIILFPLQIKFLRHTKGNKGRAALFLSFGVFCVFLLPLVFLVSIMLQELLVVYQSLQNGGPGITFINHALLVTQHFTKTVIPSFDIQESLSVYIEIGLKWAIAHLNVLFSNILLFIVDALLFLVALFFFCRDGEYLRSLAIKWSPLADNDDERMFSAMARAINSVVKGSFLSALIQGLLVGIGFTLFHVSSPVLFGTVAFVFAFIPPFGSAVISTPAAILMMIFGHLGLGLGLLIWGMLISVIDSIIRPIVVQRGTAIHPFIVLLSAIGGIAYFGLLGFLIGPIIVAALFALLELYPEISQRRAKEIR